MDFEFLLRRAQTRHVAWRLGLAVALALLGLGALWTLPGRARIAQADGLDHFVYLPLVARPLPPGIHGRVTYLGEPAVGITVTLFLHSPEGRFPLPFRYTQTHTDGSYHFTDVPALAPYCSYHVGYQNGNPINPAHLAYWNMAPILRYEVGQRVSVADFDVADVRQLSPAAGVTVTFPVTFTWEPRLTMPQDRYYCEVYMPGYPYGAGDVYWTLGSADGSCIWSAPDAGFGYGEAYEWKLVIFWPDGGGAGFGRPVTFSP